MKRLTTEEFIRRSKMVHGDRYIYNKSIYINRRTKILITCPLHGDFLQDTNSHMKGHGCVKCMGLDVTKRQTLNTYTFIAKAKQVHGDRYSYDLVEYKRFDVYVTIICPIHGAFEQTPSWHIQGCGCQICAGNLKCDTQEFIIKSNKVHDDRYSYDLVEYVNNKSKVKIICPIHGVFEQISNHHLMGHGCPDCAGLKKHTIDTFIDKARQVHGDKHSYDLVEYKGNKTKVKIICPIHGPYRQRPNDHLMGHGCPACTKTISNQEIDFTNYIRSLYNGTITTNTRSVISPYELDVYLPDMQIAFEYNGTYWHNESVTKPVGYHQMKTDMCSSAGIELHHIWESDWMSDNKFMKECVRRVIF